MPLLHAFAENIFPDIIIPVEIEYQDRSWTVKNIPPNYQYLSELLWLPPPSPLSAWTTDNPFAVWPFRSLLTPSQHQILQDEIKKFTLPLRIDYLKKQFFITNAGPYYLYLQHLGWESSNHNWTTTNISCLQGLTSYLTPRAQRAFKSLRASMLPTSPRLLTPPGCHLFPFQETGVRFLLSHPQALLADQMGLGKTPTTISLINNDPSINRILIICPASLKLNWERELRKWLLRPLSISIPQQSWEHSDITIINYDILHKFLLPLHATPFDLLVADEAHYLKNPNARRTRLVLGDSKQKPLPARRQVFLTGTPILNRPREFWTLAHALAPSVFPNQWQFLFRYCDPHKTPMGWDFDGASHLNELNQLARQNFLLRRRKSEVLTELPPKLRQVIKIEPAAKDRASLRRSLKKYQSYLSGSILKNSTITPQMIQEGEASLDSLHHKVSLAFSELAAARHHTAMLKLPFLIKHIQDTLEAEPKIVVFAHHHDLIDALAQAFPKITVTLTGKTPLSTRQQAVDLFQNDPSIRLFIGSISAAGVGITLTAASHVLFAELDWTPSNLTQAEDRLHRIGQKGSILVQHLVLEDSIDANIIDALIQKQEIIDAAIDQSPNNDLATDEQERKSYVLATRLDITKLPSLQHTIHRLTLPLAQTETEDLLLLQYLQQQPTWTLVDAARALLLQQRLHPTPPPPLPKPTRQRPSPPTYPSLPEALVRTQLRYLASLDRDLAQRRNNRGFSRYDSAIGQSLASSPHWSARQLELARKMVHKYRRQLPPA